MLIASPNLPLINYSEVIDFAEGDTTVGPPARFIVSISIQQGVAQ
jgi:hypothetical protein